MVGVLSSLLTLMPLHLSSIFLSLPCVDEIPGLVMDLGIFLGEWRVAGMTDRLL